MIIDFDVYRKSTNEQTFKMLFIREQLQTPNYYNFCIETSETEDGFPDVMHLQKYAPFGANFYEAKYSDENGIIKFQPTQPSFYRRNPEMQISVIAYDVKNHYAHLFSTKELFDKNSSYFLDTSARINLSRIFKR